MKIEDMLLWVCSKLWNYH